MNYILCLFMLALSPFLGWFVAQRRPFCFTIRHLVLFTTLVGIACGVARNFYVSDPSNASTGVVVILVGFVLTVFANTLAEQKIL